MLPDRRIVETVQRCRKLQMKLFGVFPCFLQATGTRSSQSANFSAVKDSGTFCERFGKLQTKSMLAAIRQRVRDLSALGMSEHTAHAVHACGLRDRERVLIVDHVD